MGTFGESKEDVYKRLADTLGASYVKGGLLTESRVECGHRNWMIYLDTYCMTEGYTYMVWSRIRATFLNPTGVTLRVRSKGKVPRIRRSRPDEVRITDDPISERFIVQGNNATLLNRLILDPEIRGLIEYQSKLNLFIRDDEGVTGPRFRKGESELFFKKAAQIKDIVRLRSLIELFARILDTMEAMGLTTDEGPITKLYRK